MHSVDSTRFFLDLWSLLRSEQYQLQHSTVEPPFGLVILFTSVTERVAYQCEVILLAFCGIRQISNVIFANISIN